MLSLCKFFFYSPIDLQKYSNVLCVVCMCVVEHINLTDTTELRQIEIEQTKFMLLANVLSLSLSLSLSVVIIGHFALLPASLLLFTLTQAQANQTK